MSNASPGLALVVDDDPAVRLLIKRLCETRGWKALEVSSALAALGALEAEPRLAFVDLNLGPDRGWEVVRQAALKKTAVVVVTGGDVGQEVGADALLLGAKAVLAKPFTAREFWTAVERALDGKPEGSGPLSGI